MERLFGLLGKNLEHSFSANWFARKFVQEGITDASYRLFPMASLQEWPGFVKAHPLLQGYNVTVPYKESIIPLLDGLEDSARLIGAVNCVSQKAGSWIGHNTDVIGFRRSLESLLGNHHPPALVFGSGGAAKAVAFVLRGCGIPFLQVTRRPQPGDLSYADVTPEVMAAHPLLINCTPVGMFPHIHEMLPLPYEAIGPGHFLYDLIYNPDKTLFLEEGANRGARCCNGWSMLELQAAASWTIWNS